MRVAGSFRKKWGLRTYIFRRLRQAIPTLLLSSIVVFLIIRMVPGDPARMLVGFDAPEEEVEAVRKSFGLDQPLPIQYIRWLGQVLQGDFGVSLINRFPVDELVLAKLPATLELAIAAFIVSISISLPLGMFAAVKAGKWADYVVSIVSAFYLGTPNFWLGLLYILLFSIVFPILPPSGRVPFTEDPLQALKHLVLPTLTLALPVAMVQTRFIRAAFLEVLNQDYVRTARAKGVTQPKVVLHHGFRNALIPIVTVFGIQFGHLLGGAVIIESLFAWPGVGRMMVESINNRDYAITQAGLLYLVGIFLLINLLVDVLYGVIDPRVRTGR
jgi:peptide/nickel transport system permease protein